MNNRKAAPIIALNGREFKHISIFLSFMLNKQCFSTPLFNSQRLTVTHWTGVAANLWIIANKAPVYQHRHIAVSMVQQSMVQLDPGNFRCRDQIKISHATH